MKTSERIAALAVRADVEEAKALAQEMAKAGCKQVAIDLYRCIRGDGRGLTKHLDHVSVLALAAEVAREEGANEGYWEGLLANEEVMAFAYGNGSVPEKLPMPPAPRGPFVPEALPKRTLSSYEF